MNQQNARRRTPVLLTLIGLALFGWAAVAWQDHHAGTLHAQVATPAVRNDTSRDDISRNAAPPSDNPGVRQARGLSQAFRQAAERIVPTVVTIESRSKPVAPRGRMNNRENPRQENPRQENPFKGTPFEDFFGAQSGMNPRIPGMPGEGFGGGQGKSMPQPRRSGTGSGVIIDSSGLVLTNNHVVEGADEVIVRLSDDREFTATDIKTDPQSDLAVLRIKADKLPFARLGNSDDLEIGDWVIAVGNPFGFGGTVTAGIVSSLARDVGSGPYDYLQIDAAVNRGNSGGPTFNLDGEVVGVNTAIYSPSGGSVGIAFAVPAKTVNEVINQLRTSGSVSRGWLGVKIQNVDEDTAASLGLGETRGALINEVTLDGPAARAGLKNGDTILTVNGDKIADSRDLARRVAALSPNASAEIVVLRAGKEQQVAVRLGDFKDANGPVSTPAKAEPPKPASTTDLEALGLKLSGTKGGRDGVSIVDVDAASDAALKGLRVGDTIIEVSSQPVTSVEDVSKGLAEATKLGRRALLLRVRSGDQTRFVAVQLKKG